MSDELSVRTQLLATQQYRDELLAQRAYECAQVGPLSKYISELPGHDRVGQHAAVAALDLLRERDKIIARLDRDNAELVANLFAARQVTAKLLTKLSTQLAEKLVTVDAPRSERSSVAIIDWYRDPEHGECVVLVADRSGKVAHHAHVPVESGDELHAFAAAMRGDDLRLTLSSATGSFTVNVDVSRYRALQVARAEATTPYLERKDVGVSFKPGSAVAEEFPTPWRT